MFGERKVSYAELQAEVKHLTTKVEALTTAHNAVVDVLVQELGLCLATSIWPLLGMEIPASPRQFKMDTTSTLARCPGKGKK